MNRSLQIVILIMLVGGGAAAQTTIEGKVTDGKSGEAQPTPSRGFCVYTSSPDGRSL
ncbi:MAG: hypothetical protein WAU01_17060 [Saprospiraceae bacterium]